MQERLGYQPLLERPKSEPNFFYRISRQFPLIRENPELSLAAKILSRMREATFEERRSVFLYYLFVNQAWYRNIEEADKFGLAQDELQNSVGNVCKSPFLLFMYDKMREIATSQQRETSPKLPPFYQIASMYFQSLLAPYLLKVGPDGKPLPYKTINLQIGRELKTPVSKLKVEHHVLLMRKDGRAKRRKATSEDMLNLMGAVEKLRQQNNPPLTNSEIAKRLGEPRSRIELAIKRLIRGSKIEPRVPGPLTHSTREALEKKLSQYAKEHPGQSINRSALAREMGLSWKTVSDHCLRIARTLNVTLVKRYQRKGKP